jgi:hypothetical protein
MRKTQLQKSKKINFSEVDFMAFSSIVEDSRKMNAKMIAMGQSIDIQKMPRPKPGTVSAQKAMYTPAGSELEKMLYPKNFKPRAYEPEQETKSGDDAVIIQAVNEAEEEIVKAPAKIIGDDDLIIQPKFTPKSTEENDTTTTRANSMPMWQRCKHYKEQGQRAFCKEYLGWCAKEKCSRPKF